MRFEAHTVDLELKLLRRRSADRVRAPVPSRARPRVRMGSVDGRWHDVRANLCEQASFPCPTRSCVSHGGFVVPRDGRLPVSIRRKAAQWDALKAALKLDDPDAVAKKVLAEAQSWRETRPVVAAAVSARRFAWDSASIKALTEAVDSLESGACE